MRHETQRIETSDGHRIRLDVHRPDTEPAARAAVLCHGLFTNRSEDGRLEMLADGLAERGIMALRLDFRGHGESHWSSTTFNPLGAVRDLHAAVLWCEAQALRTSLVGFSFGASTVLNYVRAYDAVGLERLALWNPVIDYRATFVDTDLPWGRGLFPEARVAQLRGTDRCRLTPHFVAGLDFYLQLGVVEPFRTLYSSVLPVLIFHGDNDKKVPVDSIRAHTDRFSANVDYREIVGAGHGFAEEQHARFVLAATIDWLLS